MKTSKAKNSTYKKYKALKATHYGLYAFKYASPCIPASVITIVNWDEWIEACGGWKMPVGMASLLISVIMSVAAITKKDDKLSESVSPLFYIAIVALCYGMSFMLLASILQNLGVMIMYTALGILSGAIGDQINNTTLKTSLAEYKELVEQNGLDPKYVKKMQKKEARKQLAVKEAQAKALAEASDTSKGRY